MSTESEMRQLRLVRMLNLLKTWIEENSVCIMTKVILDVSHKHD